MPRDDVASLHLFQAQGIFIPEVGSLWTDTGARQGLAWAWFWGQHGLGGVLLCRPPN